MDHVKRLQLISRAWGKQDGYCFFPYIPGSATNKGERIRGYKEGPAFKWPQEKEKILEWMTAHENDDLYWCPSLFEGRRRAMEEAMDEHCLWADLDEVDPHQIDDEYKPTMAWETSPGHWQALWLLQPGSGDLQGASWEGGENQRLTYMLGADQSGWDTTQLLRLPEWRNHKPEYRGGTKEGPNEKLSPAKLGKLTWANGRRYMPDDFTELPEVQNRGLSRDVQTLLEDQIDSVDRYAVWGKVRLRVSTRVREAMSRRDHAEAGEGNEQGRSGMLWEIERELADAGCTVPEIVAIVRESAWNKFEGRADELKRLTIEATKAIAERSEEVEKGLEEDRAPKPEPTRLGLLLKGIKPPRWLIQDLWAEGSCGFIAGQPKSFKSWFAMDMALSIASGIPFLDTFAIRRPGPVLYIQEEDSLPQVKYKYDRIWPSKIAGKLVIGDDGVTLWEIPAEEANDEGPDIDAYVGNGFTISNEGWQAWLDEKLSEGFNDGADSYRMVMMDPLMMIAGDVEDTKAQHMTEKIFKPLKQLSRKHEVGFGVVHHMKKGTEQAWAAGVRGGQLMLGSVANHAWSEDSLYLQLAKGKLIVETESKHGITKSFKVSGTKARGWFPDVEMDQGDDTERDAAEERRTSTRAKTGRSKAKALPEAKSSAEKELQESEVGRRGRKLSQSPILDLLKSRDVALNRTEICNALGIENTTCWKQLRRLQEAGVIENDGATRNAKWFYISKTQP